MGKGGIKNPSWFSPMTAYPLDNRLRSFLQNPEKILAGMSGKEWREWIRMRFRGCFRFPWRG
ncbi:MAG: hypothetical protein LUP97_03685 [Methanoregula sp.]|nr:hypothetical protein [Methanoregula sp.]